MRLDLLKKLVESVFAGVGTVFTFLEAYKTLQSDSVSFAFFTVLVLGIFLGLIWFAIDGWFFDGFLKGSININSNAIDVRLEIYFGEIFRCKGFKVIGVNDFFDSAVNGINISEQSLHGQMLIKYWAGDTGDWDQQIEKNLGGIEQTETVIDRPFPGKKKRYPLGTTAKVFRGEDKFLCFVLAKTNAQTSQVSSNSEDFQRALRCMLSKAREVCSGEVLNIPLLGSGLSRTGIKSNILVDLILLAIFEESKKEKITGNIKIVLPKNMRQHIDLMTIQKDWR